MPSARGIGVVTATSSAPTPRPWSWAVRLTWETALLSAGTCVGDSVCRLPFRVRALSSYGDWGT